MEGKIVIPQNRECWDDFAPHDFAIGVHPCIIAQAKKNLMDSSAKE
ncbi:MAG: hypothetical protein WC429_10670 [Verrucomicrobiia bacterium]|jgi:hypothetical protein